jgi:hypothetical protein
VEEPRDKQMRAATDKVKSETPDLMAGQWVVAFLDILGYRSLLKAASLQLLRPPPERPSPEVAKAALERAIRVRRDFIRRADDFIDTMLRSTSSMPAEIDRSRIEIFAAMWSKLALRSARFSDTLLLYTSLAASNEGPMTSLYSILLGCAMLQIIQLQRGAEDISDTLPLRGAIDVDFGIEVADYLEGDSLPRNRHISEPTLYSPALAQAYELEQCQAEYPLIIVSEQFLAMLNAYLHIEEVDLRTKAQKVLANRAAEFLHQDLDGAYFVDFMGPAVRQIASDEHRAFVARAWVYVKKAVTFHRERRDFKLARKYVWLADYMSERLKDWNIPI